jgi:hypothetical protein
LDSAKIRYLELSDFTDWSSLRGRLGDVEAVLWCLGISQAKVSRAELARVTYDFTLAGARAVKAESPDVVFVFLSGGGADPSQKSRMPFAREKGRTETALDGLGLRRVHHVRPAYIHPEKGGPKKPFLERALGGLAPVMRGIAPSVIIDARDLARAMLALAFEPHAKRVLENRDLRRLAGLRRGT